MPAVSLRLTDEQHAALVRGAHESERSLQREIVYRCFGAPSSGPERPAPVRIEAMTAEGIRVTPAGDEHFRPDFGSKLK